MATPWEQAQDFARSHWRPLRNLTKGRRPTRPLEVLETFAKGTMGKALPKIPVPAWVFVFLPKGNGLYEWADNVAPARFDRQLLGHVKLQSVMSYGGMVFSAVWHDERLIVPSVALVRAKRLYVFDQPDGLHPPLTEGEWERYAHVLE